MYILATKKMNMPENLSNVSSTNAKIHERFCNRYPWDDCMHWPKVWYFEFIKITRRSSFQLWKKPMLRGIFFMKLCIKHHDVFNCLIKLKNKKENVKTGWKFESNKRKSKERMRADTTVTYIKKKSTLVIRQKFCR